MGQFAGTIGGEYVGQYVAEEACPYAKEFAHDAYVGAGFVYDQVVDSA
ncbi:MAG: hypothetical protein R3F20_13540 [Planctomycetota bacterium]